MSTFKMSKEKKCNEQRTEVCPHCPFSRTTSKEYLDTMGENGERFAGQSVGPFLLPCHMTKEFGEWREIMIGGETAPLCAGAAKFRANLHVASVLPEELGRLPVDHETVFSTPAELLAHHRGTTVEEAEKSLEGGKIFDMMWTELQRSSMSPEAVIRATRVHTRDL